MRQPNGSIRKTRRSYNDPGHAHELTFTCYHRLPLLSKDRSRNWFLESLGTARQRYDFELWAYVIMPEHVHLLLMPRRDEYSIAAILKAIKQPVSRRAMAFLNSCAPHWLRILEVVRTNGKHEHRFWQQGGGYDRNICTDKTVWACIQYLHNNPVRRGLVQDAIDWPWSSARWYAGRSDAAISIDTPDVVK